MSIFNSLKKVMSKTVTSQMGDVAVWAPNAGGDAITAKVLFAAPTESVGIGFGSNGNPKGFPVFDESKPTVEFSPNAFPGLRESVAQKTKEVFVIGGKQYRVSNITAHYDGDVLRATLTLIL